MQQTGLFDLHNPADRAICLRLRTEQHGGGHVGPSTGLAGTMAVAESGHRFYRTNVGHTICSRCGLIPFDDDAEIPCPGVRP